MASLQPITYETVRWEPQQGRPAGAGRALGTYHPAVPASIAGLTLDQSATVLAGAEAASREITRFDAELGGEVAPFAAVLLRSGNKVAVVRSELHADDGTLIAVGTGTYLCG